MVFEFMGNCVSWAKKRRQPCKNLTLAILGLDNAGKTVTTKGLQGESFHTVAPTVGFESSEFDFLNYRITMFDIGGGKRIRDIWKNYLAEVYGLIFVVDSSDVDRMMECRDILSNLLEDPNVCGKPVLLLANKQDKAGAMDEIDVSDYLNLEEMVNKYRCPCKVEPCAAIRSPLKNRGNRDTIHKGLHWLVSVISADMAALEKRVAGEVAAQQRKESEEKHARQQRVAKIKQQREEKEAEERAKHGEGDRKDDSDDDSVVTGNPFQRLDINMLNKKDSIPPIKRSSRDNALDTAAHERIITSPRKSTDLAADDPIRSPIRRPLTPIFSAENILKPSLTTGDLSPRTSHKTDSKPAHRTVSENGGRFSFERKRSDDNALPDFLRGRDMKPTLALAPASDIFTARHASGKVDEVNGTTSKRVLAPLTQLQPLDTLSSEYSRTKKKKRTRRNLVAPHASDDDDRTTSEDDQTGGWSAGRSPAGQNRFLGQNRSNFVKASLTPRLDTLAEPPSGSDESEGFAHKWGLVDELPQLDKQASKHRLGPNSDFDNSLVT